MCRHARASDNVDNKDIMNGLKGVMVVMSKETYLFYRLAVEWSIVKVEICLEDR